MTDDQLINKNFYILHRNKTIKDQNKFIINQMGKRLNLSLEGINLSINSCLEIGLGTDLIYKYITTRFNKVEYLTVDISKNVLRNSLLKLDSYCFDNDKWQINKDKFDIIISNFYLHITNNLEIVIKNIYNSLNINGFFVATLPGINCCAEIKNCMIQADIELYNGAYRRFMENLSRPDIRLILILI